MLEFVDKQDLYTWDGLDDLERAQLRVAGQRYDGRDLPADQRLFESDVAVDGNFFGHRPAKWRVLDGNRHLYDAWFVMVDAGVLFAAGTTTVVATVTQFSFDAADPQLARALQAAARAAGAI